jgi:4-hydroxy-4-methyl-2-oxoglutarate aldolase
MAAGLDVATIGFQIVTKVPRAPKALVDAFHDCPTTDVADVVGKLFTMSTGIRPLYAPIRRVAGSAVTVKVPPGDNLMVHVALSYVSDGDILVVDVRGDTEYCMGGALMMGIAKECGVRGLVVDGSYRDAYELKRIEFPSFARGVQPRPPRKLGPGEINTVVQCGGVRVEPGDIVVADEEGIAVVPLAYAEAVLEKAQERGKKDAGLWADISAWHRDHNRMFDSRARELGCQIK